jgi:hypothetical protein
MALRHTHLLENISCGIPQISEECLNALKNLTSTPAARRAPRDISPWLCGAPLTALSTRSGCVRPTAVGNLVRLLVVKCLVQVTNENARALLAPLQLGVSVRSGAESIIHASRRLVAARYSDTSYGLLQLDFQNVCNLINREAFLGEVYKHLPALAPWVVWCYEDPSCLLFHGHVIPSGQGVQQGDPLGPLLFSLALHGIFSQL